jgi:hypothetical protein
MEFPGISGDNLCGAHHQEPQNRPMATKKILMLIRAVYGDAYVPHYVGSVHEGSELDDVELTLHELAHQVLLPCRCILIGSLKDASETVQDYISDLPDFLKDVHEIRAIAIEILVSRHWRVGINERALISSSLQNTELFSGKFSEEEWSHRRIARVGKAYRQLVRKALTSRRVLFGASIINNFLHELERLHANRTSHPTT